MICYKCKARMKPTEALKLQRPEESVFICPNCGSKGTIGFAPGETMYSEMARDPECHLCVRYGKTNS